MLTQSQLPTLVHVYTSTHYNTPNTDALFVSDAFNTTITYTYVEMITDTKLGF